MKKILLKVVLILLTLFVIYHLAKYGYENLWINGRLVASENRTHVTGVVSRYITLGKEPMGNNYYIIYKNDRRGNYYNYLVTVPSIYAIDIHLLQTTKTLYKSLEEDLWILQSESNDFKIKLYSLETGKVIKEIDIRKLLKNQFGDVQITRLASFNTLLYNGRPCMEFYIEDLPKSIEQGKIDTLRRVCIDLETEELYELEKKEGIYSPMDRKLDIFYHSRILEDNGLLDFDGGNYSVASISDWKGTCAVNLALSCLPKDKVLLYKMFPELKEKVKEIAKKEEGEIRIDIYLTDDPTEEEIMRLFLPEDKEISFENVWISGEYSIDGKDHKVESFEEYQKYLKDYDYAVVGSPILENIP